MKIIDLSHTIHDDIQIYPGDPPPSIRRGLTHEKDYCHVDLLTLGSHTGTHIDAPYHFMKNGKKSTNCRFSVSSATAFWWMCALNQTGN